MKGEYFHSIDVKGRLIVPTKLRDELGEKFTITQGLDGCLYVYSAENWTKLEEQINKQPHGKGRQLKRFFMSHAVDCGLDSQGRILIPASLRKFASLEKEVTIIGVSDRAEIWDKQNWEDYNAGIDIAQIEQAMEDIGF